MCYFLTTKCFVIFFHGFCCNGKSNVNPGPQQGLSGGSGSPETEVSGGHPSTAPV